jgi:hypothetical protein
MDDLYIVVNNASCSETGALQKETTNKSGADVEETSKEVHIFLMPS